MIKIHIDDLIPVGYFKEMCGDAEQRARRPSILTNIKFSLQPSNPIVVNYLESARSFGIWMRPTHDIFDRSRKIESFDSEKSDGVYIWPSLLSYYVKNYNLVIPSHFCEHIIKMSGSPPMSFEIVYERVQ